MVKSSASELQNWRSSETQKRVRSKATQIGSSEATTMDGGRRFVCRNVAGDEMMIGVGNFQYVYVGDEAVI